ncbi:MAG: prolipoprotein diacylglyceryl transferase [Armatimonadota bacterium]
MYSTLFHIGPVPIRSYGLMLCIALVLGVIRTARAAKKTAVRPEQVADIGIWCVLAGVVGAHLVSIVLSLPNYNPWEDGVRGLSFHGGLAGGLIAALIYTRKNKLSFLAVADLLSPALALGYAIVRIGCFLNGCCYGVPTNLPWGVSFGDVSRHPTQIYAFAINLGIFAILTRIRPTYKGRVFGWYLLMYSVYRFDIEFLRKGATAEVLALGLTEAQWVSIAMLAVAVILLRRWRRAA